MTAVESTTTAVPADRLTRLRALAATVAGLGLTGRWGWFGQDSNPYLATRRGGRQVVLANVGRATVRVPAVDGGSAALRAAREVPVYEVCPEATSAKDSRVYRRDVAGLRTPVGDWLAEVDPETVGALIDEVLASRAAIELVRHAAATEKPNAGAAAEPGVRVYAEWYLAEDGETWCYTCVDPAEMCACPPSPGMKRAVAILAGIQAAQAAAAIPEGTPSSQGKNEPAHVPVDARVVGGTR